jgi:NDP-sugar pyrophosphorylase family protein
MKEINILIPMAGGSTFFDSAVYPYPLPLTEVLGRPLIEHVINNLSVLSKDINFIFIAKDGDCKRFYLDNTLSLLTNNRSKVIKIDGETKGALCSCLMAIKEINNTIPLIISNFDQIIEGDICQEFSELIAQDCAAGCFTFESVHPRWSYVRKDSFNNIIEAAEKRPVSREAIAGFYYFSEGQIFIDAAKKSILNQSAINGQYYISSTFNELILDGKVIKSQKIASKNFHSFYTPQRIEEYEHTLLNKI